MKNYRVYLHHMQDAALELKALASESGKESTIKKAMERNFEIIGEAAKRVPRELQTQWYSIPWKDVIDIRNIIAHEYEKITFAYLQSIIANDIPALIYAIQNILDQPEE